MYNGGKNRVFQFIINQIPPHSNYVELCLGSGAVMRNKELAPGNNIGVDLDETIIDAFDYPSAMQFLNQSCLDFLKRSSLPDCEDTYIYIDPPYLSKTRTCKRSMYKFEMTEKEHVKLLDVIIRKKCMICISGYESDLYNQVLKNWRKIYYIQYDRKRRPRQEVLWCNYPEPEDLHDYNFLGVDFTDRQRIKRKVDKMTNKLAALPLLERKAIIKALSKLS